MGKYRRIHFSTSFLVYGTRSQFCALGSVYFSLLAIQQCNLRRDWRNFVKNILGTEKNHFFRLFPNIAPLTLYRTGEIYCNFIVFSQLCSVVTKIYFRPSFICWYQFQTDCKNFVKNILGTENFHFFHFSESSQIFAHKPRAYYFLAASSLLRNNF